MPTFKVIVSDPKSGKSERIEVKDDRARSLFGKRIGDEIEGELVGVSGAILRITGGSDKDGFPMRHDVHGGVRKRILISRGVGFHPRRPGERRRKTVRGNEVTEDIVQINMVKQEGRRKPVAKKEDKKSLRRRKKKTRARPQEPIKKQVKTKKPRSTSKKASSTRAK
ncbi:MAG: 30S ribosomal protein S6e [Candidatus Ranarchaeia archaeon]